MDDPIKVGNTVLAVYFTGAGKRALRGPITVVDRTGFAVKLGISDRRIEFKDCIKVHLV